MVRTHAYTETTDDDETNYDDCSYALKLNVRTETGSPQYRDLPSQSEGA
jgi:hypothetical protein